jgi:phage shock protein A
MAAAAKAAEDPLMPMVSSRMLLARSLVARQEQLHDRLGAIRRQFADIDHEVTSLCNSRYAHYSQWEERRRQQQAHSARAKLLGL